MKLLKITTFYSQYIEHFYNARPHLASASYAEQKEALDYDAFGWADFWSNALLPLGYECLEVTANNYYLQTAWAREHGTVFGRFTWLEDIAVAQVAHFQPDILFVEDHRPIFERWLVRAREAAPRVRLVMGWCGSPFHEVGVFKQWDVILSNIHSLVKKFRDMGFRSERLHHAFEARVLDRLPPERCLSEDFCFVGQFLGRAQGHQERRKLISQLIHQTPLQVFSPEAKMGVRGHLKELGKQVLYVMVQALRGLGVGNNLLRRVPGLRSARHWSSFPRRVLGSHLRARLRSPVFGVDMFRLLRGTRVALNQHIDLSRDCASNMRLFEATGVGACLLTDWQPDIGELFEPDREIVTYKTGEECVEKVRYLLAHERDRESIARAGQARTLRDHSFTRRARQLDEIIRKYIS